MDDISTVVRGTNPFIVEEVNPIVHTAHHPTIFFFFHDLTNEDVFKTRGVIRSSTFVEVKPQLFQFCFESFLKIWYNKQKMLIYNQKV